MNKPQADGGYWSEPAGDQSRSQVRDIINLSYSSSVKAQKLAALSLLRCALDERFHEYLGEDAVLSAISLCNSKSTEVIANAIRSLTALSKSETCKYYLVKNGGINLLITALKSNKDVSELALDTILQICETKSFTSILIESGVVPR